MTFLADIPDPQGMSFSQIADWLNGRMAALEAASYGTAVTDSFTAVELPEVAADPLGPEASADWRKFTLATLLADWACYQRPVDRIDLPRLKYILSSAHRYFRIWCCTLPDGQHTPVGYSAWYPLAKFVFDGVMAADASVDDRGAFLPLRSATPDTVSHGYVINISIVQPLRNTSCSARMIPYLPARREALWQRECNGGNGGRGWTQVLAHRRVRAAGQHNRTGRGGRAVRAPWRRKLVKQPHAPWLSH